MFWRSQRKNLVKTGVLQVSEGQRLVKTDVLEVSEGQNNVKHNVLVVSECQNLVNKQCFGGLRVPKPRKQNNVLGQNFGVVNRGGTQG